MDFPLKLRFRVTRLLVQRQHYVRRWPSRRGRPHNVDKYYPSVTISDLCNIHNNVHTCRRYATRASLSAGCTEKIHGDCSRATSSNVHGRSHLRTRKTVVRARPKSVVGRLRYSIGRGRVWECRRFVMVFPRLGERLSRVVGSPALVPGGTLQAGRCSSARGAAVP